jgi:hypothetical protein
MPHTKERRPPSRLLNTRKLSPKGHENTSALHPFRILDAVFDGYNISCGGLLREALRRERPVFQSDQGFSPRLTRPEISAWNAGGPNANHSSSIW